VFKNPVNLKNNMELNNGQFGGKGNPGGNELTIPAIFYLD